jgi:hypothetical protein
VRQPPRQARDDLEVDPLVDDADVAATGRSRGRRWLRAAA